MRVAILLLEDFPGSDNRVQRQCRSLVVAGHEVTVFCATGPSAQTEWEGVRIERSRVRRVKAGSLARRLYDYLAFPLSAFRWLGRNAGSFDVVQVANPPDWLVFAARPWRRRDAGRRLILDMHEPMPELFSVKVRFAAGNAVFRWLEGASVRAADVVMVVNRAFGERLERDHGIRPVVVRNAVDTRLFTLQSPSLERITHNPCRVVYAGTVQHRFGVDLVVDAVRSLRARGVDVTLDVFGDGIAMPALRRSVADDEAIVLHGQVPSLELATYLAGASVGVIPYRDSAFMRLAESSKAFEYASVGLPIICTDLPALRAQIGEDGAVFFVPGDVRSLEAAIEEVRAQPEAALRRAECVQQRIRFADWESEAPAYLALVTGAPS